MIDLLNPEERAAMVAAVKSSGSPEMMAGAMALLREEETRLKSTMLMLLRNRLQQLLTPEERETYPVLEHLTDLIEDLAPPPAD